MSTKDTVKRVYTKFVSDLCEMITDEEKIKVTKYAEGKIYNLDNNTVAEHGLLN